MIMLTTRNYFDILIGAMRNEDRTLPNVNPGNVVKALRVFFGLTQQQMADMLGIARWKIAHAESGNPKYISSEDVRRKFKSLINVDPCGPDIEQAFLLALNGAQINTDHSDRELFLETLRELGV